MDIGSGNGYPGAILSNFAPHAFVFDGVECNSMEGLVQAFKFDKPHIQVVVCKLVGIGAKRRGQKRNDHWRRQQKLWWKEREYDRDGDAYQELLDRAFEALAQNAGFRAALLATGRATLTHSIGKNRVNDTVLTEREFCSRLTKMRDRMNAGTL